MTLKETYREYLIDCLKDKGYVAIKSRSFEDVYWFIELVDNKLRCSCPGFKSHRKCKHLFRLLAFIKNYDISWNY